MASADMGDGAVAKLDRPTCACMTQLADMAGYGDSVIPGAVNWGDVPTWVQAATSTAALIAASIAVMFSVRTYKIERAREARAERLAEERRASAERAEQAE